MNTVHIALEFYWLPLHTTYLLKPLRCNYIVKWYMKCEHSAGEDYPSQTFCLNGTVVKPLKACLQILTMYWTYGKRLLKDVSSGSDFNVAFWARGLEFGKGYSSKVQFDYVSWNLDHGLAAVCPESGQTGIGKKRKKKKERVWCKKNLTSWGSSYNKFFTTHQDHSLLMKLFIPVWNMYFTKYKQG